MSHDDMKWIILFVIVLMDIGEDGMECARQRYIQ
jgi:hypothetical protein